MKQIPVKYKNIIVYALVDDKDYASLSKYKWQFGIHKSRHGRKVYARRSYSENGIAKNTFMHRQILKLKQNQFCDHINSNGLDNRRINLRMVSGSQNGFNRSIGTNNTSGFKGVYWRKNLKKWEVQIMKNRKPIYIGYFNNKEKAATAYNEAAKKYHGKFAKLNIIR